MLLLVVPIMGCLGISLYGALGLFGVVTMPGLVAQDQDAAAHVFLLH